MNPRILLAAFSICATLAVPAAAHAQCPPSIPVQGAAPPGPLPVFPADNWWNTDISSAPVDPASQSFIDFINDGGTRQLHPDFGGEEQPGSVNIYGMPYAIVDGTQPKQAVTFYYWNQSDGVDYTTHQGIPFYPIPAQAITELHWVEEGAPGNVDQRNDNDRHLIIIDCTNKHLYELYNVFYSLLPPVGWRAGSGAFFDMKTNNRRPDTWTSADAAGLAIFPGLVRYDEAWSPAVTDIGHAFRVTVRATDGYVYPASHRAGSTAGALPMGARLRLKTSVNGSDPALRTSDPNVRKIFRAMQKYGLIVADNGSDMYVTGTFDLRWNNDILNPAFALLSASDFDVIELGWRPGCVGFADVNAQDPFCRNVEWIRNRAITLGCQVGRYCPTGTVTRLQMAAFLNRLGTALQPEMLFVESASGALDVDAGPVVCGSGDYAVAGFPRTAAVDGVLMGASAADLGLDAQVVASTNGGAHWSPLAGAMPASVSSGHWSNVRVLAGRDLAVGETLRFGISVGRGSGSADLTDSRCILRVRIENRTSASSPLDQPH